MQKENSVKKARLQDESEELELWEKHLEKQKSCLKSEEEDLDNRRKRLRAEALEVDQKVKPFALLSNENDVLKSELQTEVRNRQQITEKFKEYRRKALAKVSQLKDERDKLQERVKRSEGTNSLEMKVKHVEEKQQLLVLHSAELREVEAKHEQRLEKLKEENSVLEAQLRGSSNSLFRVTHERDMFKMELEREVERQEQRTKTLTDLTNKNKRNMSQLREERDQYRDELRTSKEERTSLEMEVRLWKDKYLVSLDKHFQTTVIRADNRR